MAKYLQNLRKKGICKMVYKIPTQVREFIGIKDKEVGFKTHEELDTFVHNLVAKEPLFAEKYPEDWMLLKSWDRAFWLRHYKDKDNKNYLAKDCAFGDPQNTLSFNLENIF